MQVYYIHQESNPICCTKHLFVCSYISNMFCPDLLVTFRESHAAMFQRKKKSHVVFTVIQIIKIGLQLKYSWDTIKIQLNTVKLNTV
jgi:hypothetical protein